MCTGTDAQDALLNRVIPLKRGFIGVVNRGQKVISNNTAKRTNIHSDTTYNVYRLCMTAVCYNVYVLCVIVCHLMYSRTVITSTAAISYAIVRQ
jgi:Dynamin central region